MHPAPLVESIPQTRVTDGVTGSPSLGRTTPESRRGEAEAWVNGCIYPMGPPRDGKPGWDHRAEALLWIGDTLQLVGDNATIRAEAQRLGITPRDLGGRVVLPGFVDAHTHFLHVGVKRTRPDLRGAKSLHEALARLALFLRDHPGSHHVIGEGWDESEWLETPGPRAADGTPRKPTREDLDQIITQAAKDGAGPLDRPVVLRRICGHIAVASSGALPLIRARWDDADAVDLDTGLLLEAPSLYLNEVLASTPAELDRAVQEACREAHRLGVTTVGDYSQAPYRAALQRAAVQGKLTVRVASSVYTQQLDAEVAAGMRTGRQLAVPRDAPGRPDGAQSPWFRDGGLKVFLDGSLGGHTAHLRTPYLDQPAAGAKDDHAGHGHETVAAGAAPGCGSRIWTDAQLDHFFGTAHANGIQVHAHAIGDAAIDQGLDAYARLAAREDLEGGGWVAGNLRHRFEHYEIVHDDQVARTVELGIVASSQPNFVGEWSAKGGMYEARLGERYRLNNRFQDFLAAGVVVAFGSDGMPFGPLVGLRSAVQHPDPKQRMSPAQAIWHYTTAAAWSLHWEDDVGHLAPWMKADLVVLDQTMLDPEPSLWKIQKTIIGGKVRFER